MNEQLKKIVRQITNEQHELDGNMYIIEKFVYELHQRGYHIVQVVV